MKALNTTQTEKRSRGGAQTLTPSVLRRAAVLLCVASLWSFGALGAGLCVVACDQASPSAAHAESPIPKPLAPDASQSSAQVSPWAAPLPDEPIEETVESPSPSQTRAAGRCQDIPARLDAARFAWSQAQADEAQGALAGLKDCDLSPDQRAQFGFIKAQAALAQNDLPAALDALTFIPNADDPSDAQTPIPDLALWLRAHTMRRAGIPQAALPLLAQLTTHRASPWYHVARTETAYALFDAEEFKGAEAALTDIIKAYPEHPQIERLWLLRGQARLALGEPTGAAADFEHVTFHWPFKAAASEAQAALAPLKAPSRPFEERFDRARSLRNTRHWDLAEEAFAALLSDVATPHGTSEPENRIHYQLALNAYGASRYDVAIPRLERLADLIRTGKNKGLDAGDVYEHLVRCHAFAGHFEQALAWVNHRDRNLGARDQATNLANFLEDNGRFAEALALRDTLLEEGDKNTWNYGFLLFNAGKYRDAVARLKYVADHAQGQARARALYWIARAYTRQDRLTEARVIFEDIRKTYPLDYYAYQSANRLLELDAPPPPEPPKTLIATSPEDPTISNRDEVVASSVEGLGSSPNTLIAPAPQLPTPDEQEVARQTSPKPSKTTSPAAAASGGAEPPAPNIPSGQARIHWYAPPQWLRSGTDSAFERTAHSTETPSRAPLRAYDTAEPIDGALHRAAEAYGSLYPGLARAAALWDAGLPTEARAELRAVVLEHRGLQSRGTANRRPPLTAPWDLTSRLDWFLVDHRPSKSGHWGSTSNADRFPLPTDPADKRALAERQRAILDAGEPLTEALRLAMKEAGDYYLLRRAASPKASGLPDAAADTTRERWTEAYPRAFPEHVLNYARAHGIDPYLLWGLIHIESGFNPDSISYADARGLLQVIPMTGIKIATAMHIDAYGPADLLDERMSLRFGAWYLAQLVEKFNGQEPLAIISYNGGPQFVARWLTMRGHALELDAFIETVPFDQARDYVKKALRVIGSYRRLYDRQPTLYIGNTLDPTFKPLPNY